MALDYASFSALRLDRLFPSDPAVQQWSRSGDPEERDFFVEWMEGFWDEERAAGVTLRFPEVDGARVGAVELTDPGEVEQHPLVRQVSGLIGAPLPSPPGQDRDRTLANIAKMLEVLEIPLRFGCPEEPVRALAAGSPVKTERGGAGLALLSFDHGHPDTYWVEATVHKRDGLVNLVVVRPDLARANGCEDPEDGPDEDLVE